MLFSRDELLAATDGTARGAAFDGISCIVIDSRDVPDGALFVPIKGARFDGHDFVVDALKNGAVAALVSEWWDKSDSDLPVIVVDDAERALTRLAAAARGRAEGKLVAVTGSVGKTTTKDALKHILSGAGETHASVKSYNNHWGVPLTLANLPPDAAFGVFEMGMNHAGEIAPLSNLVRPHMALITAIAPAHIGELGSMEAIADAKAEIFSGLATGGVAVINADHDHLGRLVTAAKTVGAGRIITYGLSDRADWRIGDVQSGEDGGMTAVLRHAGRTASVHARIPGAHNLANLTGAAIVADVLGLDWSMIAERLASFEASTGRGQEIAVAVEGGQITIIDESYNANPASMRAALSVFAGRHRTGRRILVLGDMRELGEKSAVYHRELAHPIAEALPDIVMLVGDEMAPLAEVLYEAPFDVMHVKDANAAAPLLSEILDPGDVVMLKGSNGVGLGRIVANIRADLSDRNGSGGN